MKVYKEIEVTEEEYQEIIKHKYDTVNGSDSWGQQWNVKLCHNKETNEFYIV